MRVIQVIRSLTFGGAENHVLSLLLGLRERDHDVLLAAPINSWIGDQCRLHQLPIVDISMRGIVDIFSYWKLHRLIKSWQADIVHAHQVRPAQYVGIATTATKAIPICTTHSTSASKHMGRCSHVIAVCDAAVENLVRSGYPREIITRVYNSVGDVLNEDRLILREKLKIPHNRFTVVCAGRFHRDKGQDILVKVAKLCSKEIHFYFLGDHQTDFGREVFLSARDHENIHFLGYRNDVQQILSAFDIYVAPSRREAFSLSLLEASAARLPIVANRVGGIPELVHDKKNGVLVDFGDIKAFANAITRFFSKPNLGIQMGEQGRLLYEQNFTLDKMLSQIETVYKNVLKC